MVEFSKFMSSYAIVAGTEKEQNDYMNDSNTIKDKLHQFLFNSDTKLFADYMNK